MILNEEQRMLQQSVADFLDAEAPITALRTLRDAPPEQSFDASLWRQMVELGLPALTVPEAYGGVELGWMGLGAVCQEAGRRLSASPLISSAVLAQSVVLHCASLSQRELLLPAMVSGDWTASLALDDGSHFQGVSTSCSVSEGRLNGTKYLVMDAAQASRLLVVAQREETGLGVAVIDVDTDGVSVVPVRLMDGRGYADIQFENVAVAETDWLAGDDVVAGLERALAIATVALAAEMMGGARELLERTVAYLCEREQFGVKIGTFQALQHRCAQLYCDLELTQSAVDAALTALDYGSDDIAAMASAAKAMANDCFQSMSNQAVQLHGGMGVTDEMDIGLFLKRSRVCNQLLGDADWHRRRFATAQGF